MENKNNIGGLQACSNDLMNVATMLRPEGFGEHHHLTPCDIFDIIKCILVGSPCSHHCWQMAQHHCEEMGFDTHHRNEGILGELCEALEDEICHVENHRLRKQLERALDLCKCLKQTLRSINCVDNACHLVGKLFCILLQIILLIVSIIVKILVLLALCKHDHKCDEITSSFCDCLICDLEKELDQIHELIEELGDFAIAFIKFATKKCRPHHDKCHKHEECKCHHKHEECECHKHEECECHEHEECKCHHKHEECECHDDWKDHDDCECHKHEECECHKHEECECHDDWKKHKCCKCCKCHDDWKKHNSCKFKKDFGFRF